MRLSQSSGFAFGLEEAENIVFADCENNFVSECSNIASCIPSLDSAKSSVGIREEGNRTWALDVADNASGGVVHELYSDLSDTSTGT